MLLSEFIDSDDTKLLNRKWETFWNLSVGMHSIFANINDIWLNKNFGYKEQMDWIKKKQYVWILNIKLHNIKDNFFILNVE